MFIVVTVLYTRMSMDNVQFSYTEKDVEGLGLDAPTNQSEERRRIDLPTSPTFLNVRGWRCLVQVLAVMRGVHRSPQVRDRIAVFGPLPRHRQYTNEAVPTLASNTGLVPRPLSPLRIQSTNVYAKSS